MSISGLKAALAAGTGLISLNQDPYMTYNFVVEIGGLIVGGFSEVTGLSSEIELESYSEGGVNDYVHKFPKQTTYPNLVFSRGLTNIDVLWIWYEATTKGTILPLNGTIMLLSDRQLPAMWWNFKRAFPVKWEGPQFNASNATDVAVERIELVHQGIYKL